MSNPGWRDRFTQPRLFATAVAPGDRTAGLVTMVDGDGIRLHAWQVLTGTTRPVDTPPANLFLYRWLGHDGRYAYVLADNDGDELGHLTAVDLRDGAPAVDLTPTLEPYTLRGVGISRTGAGLVLDAVDADGYHIYHLARPDAADPHPRRLAHHRHEAWHCLLSADGTLATVDVTAQNPGLRRFAVQALRVADGEPVATFAERGASVEAKVFSPRAGDATVAVTTDRTGMRQPVLWHPGDDTRRPLSTGDLPGDVVPTDWSDDGRYLLLCHTWRAAQQLLRYDLVADRAEVLDLPPGSYHDDVLRTSQFGPDGAVLAAVQSMATPLAVVRHEPGVGRDEVVLTSQAPPGRPARSVDIRSSDGVLAQGWLATPAGAGPHPTILNVHGGPHWVERDSYDPLAQMWLDHGYAYLGLNFRGSTTFGRQFKEAVWGDVGNLEVEDIVAARQWLVDKRIAAPGQVFLAGGSYGGFLTLYTLSVRPELWAGGIAEVVLADWTLGYQDANPAIRKAIATWLGGTPEQVPERYRQRSALTHLAGLAAPVLIRQARHDSRTPARQLEVYEQEAKRLGKPVTVVWAEGGHAPGFALDFQQQVLDFAAACLRGR